MEVLQYRCSFNRFIKNCIDAAIFLLIYRTKGCNGNKKVQEHNTNYLGNVGGNNDTGITQNQKGDEEKEEEIDDYLVTVNKNKIYLYAKQITKFLEMDKI